MRTRISPCMGCTRVRDPRACENKHCQPWQNWFISRWNAMRRAVRMEMEKQPTPVGQNIGGKLYAPPNQAEHYLAKDPCKDCLCPKDLCAIPCKLKRNWTAARKDTLL